MNVQIRNRFERLLCFETANVSLLYASALLTKGLGVIRNVK